MTVKKAKKNPTTVNLTPIAERIKDELTPAFGLKNILSAGVVLFNGLSGDEQKKAIADAHTQAEKGDLAPFFGVIDEMLTKEAEGPRVLSEAEQDNLNKLRQLLGPEAQEAAGVVARARAQTAKQRQSKGQRPAKPA